MDRPRFLTDAASQREFLKVRSPIYCRVLSSIEEELKQGEPEWFAHLMTAWKDRNFKTDYEAPMLLLHLIHREVLAGKLEWATALNFLKTAPADFFARAQSAYLQTIEPARAIGWLLTACVGFLTRDTPFHLIDLGTSAGLTLTGDYWPREFKLLTSEGQPAEMPEHYKQIPYPVLSRIGLDARPVDISNAENLLWMRASIFPDAPDWADRLQKAAALFVSLKKEATGPRLHPVPFKQAANFIAKTIKPHPDEGLLIYNSQATDFLNDDDYKHLRDDLTAILAPWQDRAFWAEFERPREHRGALGGSRAALHELRVHRLINGQLETRVLAKHTGRPLELQLIEGWGFLKPLFPVQPPRITREEHPKQLQPGIQKRPLS